MGLLEKGLNVFIRTFFPVRPFIKNIIDNKYDSIFFHRVGEREMQALANFILITEGDKNQSVFVDHISYIYITLSILHVYMYFDVITKN